MRAVNAFGALGGFAGAYLVGLLGGGTGSGGAFVFLAASLAAAALLMLLIRRPSSTGRPAAGPLRGPGDGRPARSAASGAGPRQDVRRRRGHRRAARDLRARVINEQLNRRNRQRGPGLRPGSLVPLALHDRREHREQLLRRALRAGANLRPRSAVRRMLRASRLLGVREGQVRHLDGLRRAGPAARRPLCQPGHGGGRRRLLLQDADRGRPHRTARPASSGSDAARRRGGRGLRGGGAPGRRSPARRPRPSWRYPAARLTAAAALAAGAVLGGRAALGGPSPGRQRR
jgi:hypothetical protein